MLSQNISAYYGSGADDRYSAEYCGVGIAQNGSMRNMKLTVQQYCGVK